MKFVFSSALQGVD